MTHICVSKLTIIGSDNGLSPERRQANIWTNPGILLIGTLGTNLSEILSEIHTFSFKKMHLKTLSAKRQPFCLGLNVLTHWGLGPISQKFFSTVILIRWKTHFVLVTSMAIKIPMKFCTCQYSCAVMACAKFHSHHVVRINVREKQNFHEIWVALENFLVKWTKWPPFCRQHFELPFREWKSWYSNALLYILYL